MEADSAKRRIDELSAEISKHERLYRIDNAPEISDDDFDVLVRELKSLESRFPQFASQNSPSVRVGSDISEGFENVDHLTPMLSLGNVFNTEELKDFDERLVKILNSSHPLLYCVEPKIDGAGISAVYEKGRLIRLITRGDGQKGDDITRNAFVIKNLPLALSGNDIPSLLEIRGEAYMENLEFERLKNEIRVELISKELEKKKKLLQKNKKDEEFFDGESRNLGVELSDGDLALIEKRLPANPRNLAAGTLKLLDAKILSSRNLKAIFYSVGAIEGASVKRQSDLSSKLKSWGLPSVDWQAVAEGADKVFEQICEFEELRARLPYNTDGAVVKLDDCLLYPTAGMTSHSPRWATAWKYRAERAQTRLLKITIQVGRTGAITPVAELESVKVSGTSVSRATLHNAGYIAEKDIREGDVVVIEKAGEIIPIIVESLPQFRDASSRAYDFPKCCPECGSELKKFGEKMLFRCPNMECPPQIVERLIHFASKACMDIRGLGDRTVERLVEKFKIKDPSDFYSLSKEQLLQLDKFEEKSADNLLKSLEESKSRELWRLISGLGIPEIGEQFAKDLSDNFGSLDALMAAEVKEISSLDGFGSAARSKGKRKKRQKKAEENRNEMSNLETHEIFTQKCDENSLDKAAEMENSAPVSVRALSIRNFFDNPVNMGVIERLRNCGLNFVAQKKHANFDLMKDSPFYKKTFALTGTLKSMGRSRAKTLIENFGGKIASIVTKKTDALISAEETDSKKALDASALGVKVLNEDDFLKMLEDAAALSGSAVKKNIMLAPDSEKSEILPKKSANTEPENQNQLRLF